ncbi:hypothetical protein [uncultured Spirosoma sp.]|uniref:hypothetical protein n=1 Tax=uncultured Spirosoma sp. TaxID=278208 RepID=UPI001AD5AA60|nr:hypothetical protein [uncultured Spirosoma sp.]MBN8826312.1 hypothetical protein [Spirosoma sp.]
MMRQRSMRWKPLYLVTNPHFQNWLRGNLWADWLGLDVAKPGMSFTYSMMELPLSHHSVPPGVEHAI